MKRKLSINNWLDITDIFNCYVIVAKKISNTNLFINNAYVTVEIGLLSSLKPEQFFPFIDKQLNYLLENIKP